MGVTMESTLDLPDAAVRKMIKAAKKRRYVTHDQINAVLSSEAFTSDQIEDVFATLSEMCINVVETEEAETEEADDGKDQ
jgi:RNA polymerase primary sigma factor